MKELSIKQIISISLETGKVMLQNGAETYRVEDTIEKMISSKHDREVDVFVISTGIIISTEINDEPYTIVERIPSSSIDLETISRANSFSRLFTHENMSMEDATLILDGIKNPPKFPPLVRYAFSGMAGGFFVLLFQGNFQEFLMAYVASVFTVMLFDKLTKLSLNFFIKNIFGGFTAATLGLLLVLIFGFFGIDSDYNKIIVGPLMTLVPGVSLTNGIRDLISGELIAGNAKIMEALFIAIGLAFGVGMALQIAINIL